MPAPTPDDAQRRRNRVKLLGILAVCATPVIASYFTYYVVKPEGRTNYGALVDPQVPVGKLALHSDAGAERIESFRGKWLMLALADGACDTECERRLVVMRQVRLTTGKDRDRIERALLIAGDAPAAAVLAEHEGLRVLRASPAALAALRQATGGEAGVLLVDPLGNLMMRFPVEADPSRMKKDIAKLLRASRIG
jgi:hypothetical protein